MEEEPYDESSEYSFWKPKGYKIVLKCTPSFRLLVICIVGKCKTGITSQFQMLEKARNGVLKCQR